MKDLKNIETYQSLIKDARKKGGKFTNNNLLSEDIKRFIELQRIKYFCSDSCLIFILDEEKYYRLLLHLNPDSPWALPELDKPILVQTRFVKGKKKPSLLKLEEELKAKGFILKDTHVQITLNVAFLGESYRQKYLRSKKLLDYSNLRIITADYSYYNQINILLKNQDMMEYFLFPYQTDEEIKTRFENGDYLAIINEENEILAYLSEHQGLEKNSEIYAEAMVIKEEYKLYGFAPILYYYSISNKPSDLRKTIVALNNFASIEFYKKFRWKFTDRYMEHWLLEKENEVRI